MVRLHYTANPTKRNPEWKMVARRGLSSRDWEREYEINWHIASGLPIYAADFSHEWNVSKRSLEALPGLAIVRGWDFGLSPACVFCQVTANGCVNVLHEMYTWRGHGEQKHTAIDQFARAVVLESAERFPDFEFRDFADPAGWQRSQTDEKTCVQIMRDLKIFPAPGPVGFKERQHCVNQLLTMAIQARPGLLVSNSCVMIVEGMQGAYRFVEIGETGRHREKADKNAWSHIMNALEYAVGGLFANVRKARGERGESRESDEDRPWRIKPKKRKRGSDPVSGY